MTDDDDPRPDAPARKAGLFGKIRDLASDTVEAVERAADSVEDLVESAIERRSGDHCDRVGCDHEDCDSYGKGGGGSGGGGGGGRGGGGGAGGRPGKTVGTSRGEIDGSPLTPGDLHSTHPANSWPGPRKDMPVPLLFLRANPGDNGTRPVLGPFWESPDIHILAGIAPAEAPEAPNILGQTALAGAPNTIYAHIWNFGRGAAYDITVEFWWLDPSLGVTPQGLHFIGQTPLALGARGSGNSHAIVKCPEAWNPTFLNGGHECLIVRASTTCDDILGTPAWDASLNRHVGQRNIHVIGAAELAAAAPVQLQVGPLYGAPATVTAARAQPTDMPWLQLHTGQRGRYPLPTAPTGTPALSPPAPIGDPPVPGTGATHTAAGDNQQVAFSTDDAPPGPGQAAVYRITADQGGQTVGGYTVVVVGT
ncbi:MAG: hypothetical protein M3Y42_03490 [Actinomycetota bacterium]|nr:hypothetical protein [Actinomycetota bacterium]